ncbi:hypothetical protein [Methylobacterium sp. sgz302541]|uniref:hypothetical protein n=1 Tax=unclassified Methylobacterium TaxID=2615210 RepID=UPI003D3361FB
MDASRRTTFRNRLKAAAAAGLLIAASAGAARAQYVFDDEILPPRVVAWRLAERGFSGLSRPRFDGRAYVVEAFAPNGGRVRLFVDAHEGDIVGRQRLDAPLYPPPIRVGRPVSPGYGWTEEDADSARPLRQAERLIPPADIPNPGPRPVAPGPAARIAPAYPEGAARRADLPGRPETGEANPLGVNPDARRKPEAPRKSAKLVPPAKPVAPRVSPEAPAPAEAAHREPKAPDAAPALDAAKPGTAKPDAAKSEVTKTDSPPTPASVQPPPAEVKASEVKPGETRTAEAKKDAESWKDPATEKRPVRVIGGATIVPGTEPKGDAAHTE